MEFPSEQIRDAIRRNGLTPKGAEAKAVGHVIERRSGPAFEVSKTDVVYVLAGADQAMEAVRKLPALSRVAVRGRLPPDGVSTEPMRLEFLALEPEWAAGATRGATPVPAPRPRGRAR